MKKLGPTFWMPVAALIGVAGCSSSKQTMDDELKRDLSAAVRTPSTQLVVSPLEAGIAPAPKAPQRTKAPTRRPAKQVEAATAPAPVAQEVAVEAEPVVEQVEVPAGPAMQRPTSRPAQTEERRGPYKTEAEIFRQFPMIRP